MTRLPTSDVEALVVLIDDLDAESAPAPFTPEVRDRLAEFVGCDKHLENVYGKLGVHSRTAALAQLRARSTNGSEPLSRVDRRPP